ncbi:organic cation transporter protein-like isoform X2 [Photinus pyralis]|uniref:organic cation transporter protein-like isoform X2 n=1 Tax=Photinus pyralis TaxID=7054 RepID=UPI00126781DC|nr:organic cation transporter protein-like isoform X2 [Photinus pyralis]
MNENSLDTLLSKIGEFGRYQIRVITLLLLVIAFSCSIPECDEDVLDLKPAWWTNAIPSISNEPAKCSRFKSIGNINGTNCSSIDFDKNILLACDEYIYETSERSILQDFNLHCDENLWKLTTVGTLNSIGSLIGLPLIGILSDKYGRKTILINSILLCAISGLIRSFVNSYIFYMVMVFVDSFFNAATYTTAFTLAVEFISPKQRVIVVSLISLFYAFGGVITGTVAWLLQSWRPLLQILYGVQLLIVTYYWLLPESVRWLLIKERYLEAQKILNDIGREKQFNVPLQTLKDLQAPVDQLVDAADVNTTLKQFFKSFALTTRLINCIFCWIVAVFVYQGLTINSVALSTNTYFDFILTVLIEVPGALATFFVMKTFGRRFTLCFSFFMCSICCISFIFIPQDLYWLRLCIYLLGKCFSAMDFSVMYAITTEMFPTPLRNLLLSVCSMFARTGSMIAPHIPLLELIWKPLPLILFGITSLMSGVLCLKFPETKDVKLPDTIDESISIGTKKEITRCNT